MSEKEPQLRQFDSIQSLVQKTNLLIVTATPIESQHLLLKMHGKPIIQTTKDSYTYTLGRFGIYHAVHVQCEMGSVGRSSAITTITAAINYFNPTAILMVGIAFGVDSSKQNIGDVLVSEFIIPYDNKRAGKTQTIYRSYHPPSGPQLLNRFKQLASQTLPIPNKLLIGPILSGETLIDNVEFRAELLSTFPHAIGGEMEGVGLSSAADSKKIEWILVKGICDFADGNKADNKTQNQQLAIQNAVALCETVFSKENIFVDLKLVAYSESQEVIHDPKLVLFDVYTEQCKEYYVKTSFHEKIISKFDHFDIWLSGKSGVGKTTLVLHHLAQDKNIKYVSLASTIGQTGLDTLRTLCFEIVSLYEQTKYTEWQSLQLPALIQNVIACLERHSKIQRTIYVDEIPLSNQEEFKIFLQGLAALLITIAQKLSSGSIKFVFTTINSPLEHIDISQMKIKERVCFVSDISWTTVDLERLCDEIAQWLKLKINPNHLLRISDHSKGSPRFIKKFFKNLLAYPELNFNDLILLTDKEIL